MELKSECAHCGAGFSYAHSIGRPRKYCSDRCRQNAFSKERWAQAKTARGRHKIDCRGCGNSFEADHKRQFCSPGCRTRHSINTKKRKAGECPNCLVAFSRLTHNHSTYCSESCREEGIARTKRANWSKWSAIRKSAYRSGENIDPLEIFMRDGWKCKSCKRKTPAKHRGAHSLDAPELDHIVPLSKGGSHTRTNVQLLCRECNLSKGSGALADQLIMFG